VAELVAEIGSRLQFPPPPLIMRIVALRDVSLWRSFDDPAMIGRHAGGPSEDFGEIVKEFRLRLRMNGPT
jgi:hypothetical protein